MKTAIVYYSAHHGNTKKLVDAITEGHEVTLVNAARETTTDLSEYDLVGFASGIYYSKFHKSVLQFAKDNLPESKKTFFLYTYGAKKEGYTKAITEAVKSAGGVVAGEYGCFGFNTFGPFKLVGGMAKGHPTEAEIQGAVSFFEEL